MENNFAGFYEQDCLARIRNLSAITDMSMTLFCIRQ